MEGDNIIVKWAQEDVETSCSLLNNNYYYSCCCSSWRFGMLYVNLLHVALPCGLQCKLSRLHTLLAAPSQTQRKAHKPRKGLCVTADIQGGEQFGRSGLWNYFNQIWRQWHAEHTYRGVGWHFPSAEISAKRIFQLASPAEKLAYCSVGTLKNRGLTRACCIYYSINDASVIRWLRSVMSDWGQAALRANCRNCVMP